MTVYTASACSNAYCPHNFFLTFTSVLTTIVQPNLTIADPSKVLKHSLLAMPPTLLQYLLCSPINSSLIVQQAQKPIILETNETSCGDFVGIVYSYSYGTVLWALDCVQLWTFHACIVIYGQWKKWPVS